ncbi:hypothetical protein FACS18949_06590 [Clostridia bacterium]|nr:hypothetical protein FACS189425_09160 [Clostridia bacterium]GHV33227.1 hypothetical protein FACS18949_06590 [Clostridia bacterium]
MKKSTIEMFGRIFKTLQPPPDITISEWADRYRIISAGSALPGRWDTNNTPYLREIMDAISDTSVEKVVLMCAAQLGKTMGCILNSIGYYMHLEPCPIMVVQPTVDMAQSFSKEKLAPMLADTPILRGRTTDKKRNFTSSYSASRGALLEAWKMFKMYRSWLAMDFCQPIYEEWLSEAVSKGRIPAPGFFASPLIRRAYCGAEWNGPAQGQLDPKKEVEAAELRVRSGLSTRSREAMELNGSDFNNNIRQLRQEKKMMKEVSGGEKQDIQPSELDKASPGDTDTE